MSRPQPTKPSSTGDSEPGLESWLREQVAEEPIWFHRLALRPDLVTPGISDPAVDKLPYFGLPEDLSGQRVLDIGCAEGFFSFEAERRGAAEVVAIEPYPDSGRRFQLVKIAEGSKAILYRTNVYDLDPRAFGTFDLVLFFGVLYHLRNPMLALERIREVCTGTILVQSACEERPELGDEP
ncbi:MAG: class I SAM-dependent methyltransferase [Acidobacteriota bacterium]